MKSISLTLLATVALAVCSQAQVLWTDDLESGIGNWTRTAAGREVYSQSGLNQVPSGGDKSLWITNSACRAYVNNLPSGFGITDQNDSCRFSYWLYDPNTNRSVRGFAEVRAYVGGTYGSGDYLQILAIGPYNSASVPPANDAKYHGRVVSGYPAGWFTLNGAPDRTAGWHHFAIERGVNTAGDVILKFYQDGILGRAFTNSGANKLAIWDSVVVGLGGGSTAGNQWHDGYEVAQGQAFIGDEPQSSTNLIGTPATLSVYAYGSADTVTYQWSKDGTIIEGATDSSYTVPICQASDSGWYSVMVSNVLGARTSSAPARLEVAGVNILTQPTNQVVNLGSNNVSFYCEAASIGTPHYQWSKDGANIAGATDPAYTIAIVGVSDLATDPGYVCLVSNDDGYSATSVAATLKSNAPPSVTPIANIATSVGTGVAIPVLADDDYSTAGVFQTFESGTVGAGAMFLYPRYSGTAFPYVSGVDAYTYVTNSNIFPAGNPRTGAKALFVTMNFTNETTIGWDRLTTYGYNPIVWFVGPIKFDIWTDRPMGVSVGLHENSPTGPIGSNGGTSSSIENVGVSTGGSIPNYIYSTAAGVWTNFTYDLADWVWPPDPGSGFLGWAETYIFGASLVGGNGILDSTTGKGVLENLGLVPADGLGTYKIYVDNFQSLGPNWLKFSLDAAPSGATIDPYSGLIQWAAEAGAHNFTVRLTDHLGLYATQSFSVVVTLPPISITLNSSSVQLDWSGTFQLQSNAVSVGDLTKWYDVPGVTTAPYNTTASAGSVFFRLRN